MHNKNQSCIEFGVGSNRLDISDHNQIHHSCFSWIDILLSWAGLSYNYIHLTVFGQIISLKKLRFTFKIVIMIELILNPNKRKKLPTLSTLHSFIFIKISRE